METTTKITKFHTICHLLATFGPMTRPQILRRLATHENRTTYKSAWDNGYFLTYNWHLDLYNCPSMEPKEINKWRKKSLLASGYIKIVSQSGRFPVYDLDALGFIAAAEYLQLSAAQ